MKKIKIKRHPISSREFVYNTLNNKCSTDFFFKK